MTTPLIIHISGPSGSGKSFLGQKLTQHFGNNIVVKDIDHLQTEFIKKHYGEKEWNVIDSVAYQQFIDDYVARISKNGVPLVFVGLNYMPWWHDDLYYDMHAAHTFYIDIDYKALAKQKCIRYLTKELKDIVDDEIAMKDLMHNNEKFIRLVCKGIKAECDVSEIAESSNKLKKDYKKQGYQVMTSDDIYHAVVRIIQAHAKKGGMRSLRKTKKMETRKRRTKA